jgi:hypothetical protein
LARKNIIFKGNIGEKEKVMIRNEINANAKTQPLRLSHFTVSRKQQIKGGMFEKYIIFEEQFDEPENIYIIKSKYFKKFFQREKKDGLLKPALVWRPTE